MVLSYQEAIFPCKWEQEKLKCDKETELVVRSELE
jgi:hypothetical protein